MTEGVHSELRIPNYFPSRQRISPYTTLLLTPKTITGPAITNIRAAVPVMSPSVLNSRAGAATELAK